MFTTKRASSICSDGTKAVNREAAKYRGKEYAGMNCFAPWIVAEYRGHLKMHVRYSNAETNFVHDCLLRSPENSTAAPKIQKITKLVKIPTFVNLESLPNLSLSRKSIFYGHAMLGVSILRLPPRRDSHVLSDHLFESNFKPRREAIVKEKVASVLRKIRSQSTRTNFPSSTARETKCA